MEILILDPLVVIQETISSKHSRVKHSYETPRPRPSHTRKLSVIWLRQHKMQCLQQLEGTFGRIKLADCAMWDEACSILALR